MSHHTCTGLLTAALALLLWTTPAAAQPRSEADVSGYHLGIGPVANLTRVEGTWDGSFGGEIGLARVRERDLVSILAVAAGATQFTERSGGRVWLDAMVGTRTPLGGWLGVGLGPAIEVHKVNPPRWGVSASLWVYAGITPYVRIGHVQRNGTFVDIGLRLVLPAVRW